MISHSLLSYVDFIFLNNSFFNLSNFFQMYIYLFKQQLQYINYFFFVVINFLLIIIVLILFMINRNHPIDIKKYIWNFIILYFYFFIFLYLQSNFFPLYYVFYKSVWFVIF